MRKCQDSITVETSFVPEEGAKACGCDDASHCRKCIPAFLHGASISREDTHGSQARRSGRTSAASRSVAADPRSATGDCADCTVGGAQARAGAYLDSYRATHRSPKPADSSPPGSPSDGPAPEVDCPTPVEIDYDDYDKKTGELVGAGIQRIPCGRKRCPVCGPRLKSRYIAHFAQRFTSYAEGVPVFFATLTVDPKIGDLSHDEARRYLLYCWDKWMKRLRRRANGDVHYVASIEQHKDGRYHLHAILAASFDGDVSQMLREQWFESGGGAVSEVKRITVGSEDLGADKRPTGVAGAVGYVLKYAFKDVNTASGRRSVVCSQGDGYHSAQAKAEREAFYKSTKKGQWQERQKKKRERDWHSPTNERPPRPMRDTITPEDRARFDRLDKSRRSRTYRQPEPDGTWKEYTYRKEKGDAGEVEERLTWVQYSTYPDDPRARVVDTSE